MTIDINLDWKAFKVDMNLVHAWLAKNAGDKYCGCSANSQFQVHFTDEPGQDVRSAVVSYWNKINKKSAEYKNYQSAEDRRADVANAQAKAKASGLSKLKALGLTDDEINALMGQ